VATLGLLDDDRPPSAQPVLPATLDGRPEAMLFLRDIGPHDTLALRIWLAPMQFEPKTSGERTPLWIGATQQLHYSRPLKVFGLWRPVVDGDAAHARLRADLAGMQQSEQGHPESRQPVLRVRER